MFFTILGALNERYVAGMAWSEVAVARTIGAPLMIVTARPYGVWRDFVMRRFGSSDGFRRSLADGAALLMFQVPIYAAILFSGGAEPEAVTRGSASFAVLMLIVGRPYGLWLDFVRARFGLQPGGMTPMTLGDRR